MFDPLFTPLTLGQIKLTNRICFLAHRSNFARKGRLTDRHFGYYQRRAAGGCGLIILGELTIHPNDRPWESMIEVFGDSSLRDFQRFTAAIHQTGTPILAQLTHHGFQSSGAINRLSLWGPSALGDISFGEVAKAMEVEDIHEVLKAFSQAAQRIREGGFDGIEIDIGPESLLRQFLSPISNYRQDDYGGSLENRMRLVKQVLEETRKAVGSDYTVGIRLCCDEKFWGGISPEEASQVAQLLEQTGMVDFIDVTLGTYYNLHLIQASLHTPPGYTVELAGEIKKTVHLPVMTAYQINTPELAELIITVGKADLIGYVRQLICDPDFPNKVRAGEMTTTRFCVRDNQGCLGRIQQSKTLSCIQNPEVGFEQVGVGSVEFGDGKNHNSTIRNPQSAIKKKVMVIGAGPGGLAAARAAAIKGHQVTVYEKDQDIGGQINLIRKRPARRGMWGIIENLRHQLAALEVPILTNQEMTLDLVLEEDPAVVIVATGSKPISKPVPGQYGPPTVLTVWEVLEGSYPLGERLLFIDEKGGHHGAATVELLADQGKKVDMITSDLFIGIELAPLGDLYLSRQRLLQKGVTFTTDVFIDEIQGTTVQGRDIFTNQLRVWEGYETIVLDMGNQAEDRLYKALKGKVRELYRLGDCLAPRGIDRAIYEGWKVGQGL